MTRMFPSLPDSASLGDVMQRFPRTAPALLRFIDAVMVEDAALHQGDRELIAAYVSALNACQYCMDSHLNAAAAFGVDPDILSALLEDVETAPIEAPLKPLLRYVGKLTQTPARMIAQDAEAVYAAGWDEAALHAAIEVAGLFAMMNRIVMGTDVSADTVAPRAVTEEEKTARRAKRYSDMGRALGLLE